jgi:hypothetical protein
MTDPILPKAGERNIQYGICHLNSVEGENVFVGGAKAGKSESGHLVTCPEIEEIISKVEESNR